MFCSTSAGSRCASFARNRRLVALLAIAALCPLLCACGKKGPPRLPVFAVQGQVFQQGQPAEGAVVILHPDVKEKDPMWDQGYPRGVVQADGSFTISTYSDADGAPAWQYVVLVTSPSSDPNENGGEGGDSPEVEKPAPSKPNPYAKPTTSPVKFKVIEQPSNTIPRIDLP